jgi:hypothetical protein
LIFKENGVDVFAKEGHSDLTKDDLSEDEEKEDK